jgi:hypothetical protein
MLIRPLDDLAGGWLGHALDRHRLQERHMEFLAVLWLGHQACENDQLDHLRTPLSPQLRPPSGYAITAAFESRARCASAPSIIEVLSHAISV